MPQPAPIRSGPPRTVVVTGASAGVGRATALRFAADGDRIGLIARDRTRLEQAAAEVVKRGGRALACPTDVTEPAALEKAADEIEAAFGPIDIWVNCAMATVFAPFLDISPKEYRRATDVTYLGFVYGTMTALRRMKQRDHGVIVQVGSALAYRSIPLQSAYCGAKHAIVGFTDSIRSELLHDGSRVKLTVVHLPAVNTPQFDWARNKMARRPQPLPPIYQPEVAAEAIHYVALRPQRELWLGWSAVKAIVGQKIAPGLLDRIMARRAYGGQQSDEPALDRRDNLFDAVPGDYGAHGRFDDKATPESSELWFAKNTRWLATAAVAIALVGVAGLLTRSND